MSGAERLRGDAATCPAGRWTRKMATAAVMVIVAASTACSTNGSTLQGSETSLASADGSAAAVSEVDCPVDGAQWLTLTKRAGDEPTIHVPVTPGWTLARDGSPDQPTVRGLLGNEQLREKDHSPLVQVTLNRLTDSAEPLDKVTDQLMKDMGSNPTIDGRSHGEVCGTPVYRTDFTASHAGTKMSGTQLVGFVDAKNSPRWAAMAVLLTANPDNPGFTAQRDAMLKGFHLSVP